MSGRRNAGFLTSWQRRRPAIFFHPGKTARVPSGAHYREGATSMGSLGRALILAAATAAAVSCAGADAHALGYRDILGRWCSATARLEFARQAMGLYKFADKSRSSSKVQRYEFTPGGAGVIVHW